LRRGAVSESSVLSFDRGVLSFDKGSPECTAWVEAHRYCGGDEYPAAKALLDVVKFVDEPTFTREVEKCMEQLSAVLQNAPADDDYVWVIPDFTDRKSQDWLDGRYRDLVISKLDPEKRARLRFASFAQWKTEKLTDGPVTLLMVDDGIYSGTQMDHFYQTLISGSKIGKIKKVLTFVPYSTEYATLRFQPYRSYEIPLEIVALNRTPTVRDVPAGVFETLGKMGHAGFEGHGNIGTQFFAHKIPDYLAAPKLLFEDGVVSCSNGRYLTFADLGIEHPLIKEKVVEFSCIPHISPPYKRIYEDPQRMDEKCLLLPEGETDYCKRWKKFKGQALKKLTTGQ